MLSTDGVVHYAYPSEDLSSTVTPTLTSGTQDPEYPIANLAGINPAKPWKVTTTTFRLLWDFGSAVPVYIVALIHANLQAALGGVILAFGSTTATSGFSTNFTIGPYDEQGYPSNSHLDLSTADSGGPPTYRYMSLAVTVPNIVVVSIGKILIARAVHELPHFIIPKSPAEEEQHPMSEHSTDAGVVTIFSLGVRRRWVRGEMAASNTNAALLKSWRRSAGGRTLPFLLLPHLSPDEVWYARFEKDKMHRTFWGSNGKSFIPEGFEEVSRGLKPTPSAV